MGEGSGWPANSVNSFWKCFDSGSYKFTITDGYGDGICCSYGNGGYSVKVDDKEVASGGQFGSEESKTFEVGSSTPTTPSPSTSAPVPAPTPPPTPVTSSSVFPSTAAPVPTPDATPYPTGTAPTMYPTQTAPTMYPTAAAPVSTPYPTGTPPTLYPTGVPPTTCGVKGDTCTKHKQCCGKKCNLKKNTCRK